MRVTVLVLFVLFSMNVEAEDKINETFFIDLAEATGKSFCGDEATRKYIGRNYQDCLSYISEHPRDCGLHFLQAAPKPDSVRELLADDRMLQHLVALYFSCVKAEIMEDVEGVDLF